MENARNAALADRRFQPVTQAELDKIEIEVSVLTTPSPLSHESPVDLLSKLRPEVDGVVLRVGSKQATYLPQVWEQFPNKQLFLSMLAKKAKLDRGAWQSREARILTYQAEAFSESES